MSLSIEDIRRIGQCAVDGPIPHDGLREFMEKTNTVKLGEYYSALHLMAKLMQGDYGIELGVELSRGIYAMATGSPVTEFVGIEQSGRVPSTWMTYAGQCSNICIVSGTDTVAWLENPHNRRRRFSLAHIDSGHTADLTTAEWYLLRPLMEPGGAVAFDDINTDGVRKVWNEINLPKVEFTNEHPPCLHGDNGWGVVLT